MFLKKRLQDHYKRYHSDYWRDQHRKKTPGSKTWQPAIDSNKGSPVELTAELKSP
jgi:hypothetical protein